MTDLEQKFTEIVKEYKTTIYTVCMMYAENPDETDDYVQEVLINIWKGFQKADGICKAWIWKITINTCVSVGRRHKKHATERLLEADIKQIMDCGEAEKDNANVKLLYERIHRLNPFDRSIVLLWLEGLPYDEIGEIIGISASNVSVRLFRIKQQLKNMNNG